MINLKSSTCRGGATRLAGEVAPMILRCGFFPGEGHTYLDVAHPVSIEVPECLMEIFQRRAHRRPPKEDSDSGRDRYLQELSVDGLWCALLLAEVVLLGSAPLRITLLVRIGGPLCGLSVLPFRFLFWGPVALRLRLRRTTWDFFLPQRGAAAAAAQAERRNEREKRVQLT